MANGRQIDIKVVVLGNKGSGKTALTQSWLTDKYPSQTTPTIGVDSVQKEIKLSNSEENLNVLLWDTAGTIPDGLLNGYFSGADLCFITVDATLTHRQKLEQINKYRELIKKRLTQFPKQKPPRVVVIETKFDAAINHVPVETSELNQNDDFIKVEKVISTSAKENFRVDIITSEILETTKKSQSEEVQTVEVKKSASLLSLTGLFSNETKPILTKNLSNSLEPRKAINLVTEKSARLILNKLLSRLLEGAISDKNKAPYEVSFFGSDYVEYTTDDSQRQEIKIPKTVAKIIAKIKTIFDNPSNEISAKEALQECYQDILNAANSSCFTRYKSTQNFYKNILPKYIETLALASPMQLTDFEITPRSEQSSISP